MELLSLTPNELGALMPVAGRASATRGKALWHWLRAGYPAAWPETIPNVAASALDALKAQVELPALTIEARRASRDGTIKWLARCRGRAIETVMIPTDTRATVCVSSQSGCTRWCDFCATARMGFGGQLSAGEIVAQVLLARDAAAAVNLPLTNVVFMGMGEPLDNLDAVLTAIRVLDEGLVVSPKHCTVSTSGVLPRMQELWDKSRASVALSLHATTQELRDKLMPRVRKWPLEALCAWMREASAADAKRHFFIEYAMLADTNDSDADADRLVALLSGVRARVNLIPFNATEGVPYQRPSAERISAFQARVMAAGLITIVRETRGEDAAAACGQLAAADALG